MIDTVQAVLLFVIVLLTILFVVLGIQVFYILRDLRQTIKKTNNILDNVENVSAGLTNSFNSVTNMFGGASTIGSIAGLLSMFRKKPKE